MLIIHDLQTRTNHWLSNHEKNSHTGTAGYNFRPGLVVMKFGEQLRTSIIREYQWYYIDYDGLKAQLKAAPGRPADEGRASTEEGNGKTSGKGKGKEEKGKRGKKGSKDWTAEQEELFVNTLYQELEKVHTKQKVKASEIARRIAASEREVKEVVGRLEAAKQVAENGGVGSAQHEVEPPSEEEFMLLEEDLSDIIADVHDLAKFVQVNYTGFQKIIKKHDVSPPRLPAQFQRP
jgi:SPX domain protein involved in polyphosphate accumulation